MDDKEQESLKLELKLKPGERCSICTCGHSKTLPLCDNSHREVNLREGTNYHSLKIEEQDGKIYLSSTNWKEEQK